MSVGTVQVDVHLPPGGPLSGMAADVRIGLTKPFKELSPRYFYDELGSELFERITATPEYYPTRAERAILENSSAEIVDAAGNPATLIELGSALVVEVARRELLEWLGEPDANVGRHAGERSARWQVDVDRDVGRGLGRGSHHPSLTQRRPEKICRRCGRSQLRNVVRITLSCVAQEPPRSTLYSVPKNTFEYSSYGKASKPG